MSVTTLESPINEVSTMSSVDTPDEAIDLVFEQVDADRSIMLDHETLQSYVATLRCGYGCTAAALPVQLATVATLVERDKELTMSTSTFIDMLWELRLLVGADELAAAVKLVERGEELAA